MKAPRISLQATWRGTSAPLPRNGQQRLIFDCEDGSILDVTLSGQCVQSVIETLTHYREQSKAEGVSDDES